VLANAGAILIIAAVALGATSCESVACPDTVAEARAGNHPQVENAVVALGRVARFVPATAPESRGYDLDILETYRGSTRATMFLETGAELAGIQPGMAVLIVAQQGADRLHLRAGDCVPLMPIPAEELPGGAAEPQIARLLGYLGSLCGRRRQPLTGHGDGWSRWHGGFKT
jgi:hypothetical protein